MTLLTLLNVAVFWGVFVPIILLVVVGNLALALTIVLAILRGLGVRR